VIQPKRKRRDSLSHQPPKRTLLSMGRNFYGKKPLYGRRLGQTRTCVYCGVTAQARFFVGARPDPGWRCKSETACAKRRVTVT
jgi:hypothetical protein